MARRSISPAEPDDIPVQGPVRTCIGCRQRAAKRELLRVTASADPTTGLPVVWPDLEGTAPGRGAHLHPTSGCYDLAVRRKAFSRALRFAQGAGGPGLSSVPVGEFVASLSIQPTASTKRDWSSSS